MAGFCGPNDKERLLKSNDYFWVTRVPETITEAKKLVEMPSEDIVWVDVGNGYKISRFESLYGEIRQRWLLVFSEQAYNQEKKTLEKKMLKEAEKLKQALWHFGNQVFHCEKDATKSLEAIRKGYKLHNIVKEVITNINAVRKKNHLFIWEDRSYSRLNLK